MKYIILLSVVGCSVGAPGYLDSVYDFGLDFSNTVQAYGNEIADTVQDTLGFDVYARYNNGSDGVVQSFWDSPLETAYSYISSISPMSVRRFLNTSVDEGSAFIYELKADLQGDFMNDTKKHVEELKELGYETYRGLEEIFYTVNEIMQNGGSVPEDKLESEKEHLKELENYLVELETELTSNSTIVDETKEKDLEHKIRELIQEVRQFLLGEYDGIEKGIWTRVDRLKLQSIRTRAIVISSLGQLSKILAEFFADKDKIVSMEDEAVIVATNSTAADLDAAQDDDNSEESSGAGSDDNEEEVDYSEESSGDGSDDIDDDEDSS